MPTKTTFCKQALKTKINKILAPFAQLTEVEKNDVLFANTKHFIALDDLTQIAMLLKKVNWTCEISPSKRPGQMMLYIHPKTA